MSEITTDNSSRPRSARRHVIWIAPFTWAAAQVASARHSHNWDSTSTQISLAMIVAGVSYSAISLHKLSNPGFYGRFANTVFLVSTSLCAFVLATRLLFPIPSSALNDAIRINRILDQWLFWPFAALTFVGIVLAARSPRWQQPPFILYSVSLVAMFAFSMNDTTKHWLRSFTRLFD